MSFTWPVMLYLLLLIPVFIWIYLRMQQRRRKIMENYGSLGFVQQESGQKLEKRRHIPPALFLLSLTILTFALARPKTVLSLPRVEGTVMLVFDVSGSMAATDLKPTRMEAAKTAAEEFVQHQPSNIQIGVVAFSEGGLEVLAPTNDQQAILASIRRLSPQRGTSLANGIVAALNAIYAKDGQNSQPSTDVTPAPTPTPVPKGTYSSATIVLLTDGENNMAPDPLTAAKAAADRGVRIHSIGIGSVAGTVLKVNGFTVFTKLDEATLQQISKMTDGKYFNAKSEEDLRTIYKEISPELVVKKEQTEITSILSGLGIFLLLIGGAFSLLWFSRVP